MVLQQYALCPRAGYDVVAVTELCNPDLTSAFESRLRQLQSRAGKPAFAPRFASEAEAQQRGAVIDVLRAHAAPFHDVSYPDVTILAAWHGTDSSILPSIMSASFANLASTDSGFFGKGIYASLDAEYADRCYASFDHAKQRERDTGALLLCCVSLFSAYPVIGRSDMDKLQGKGNYQNYDAHIVPVVPADGGNPRELNYFPCEAASLSPPFPGFTYMELVLFESAQVLPCFVVHLSRSRIPRPLLPAPGVPREIDLRYHRMLQGHGMHNPASAQLLQALSLQPQLVAFIEAGDAAAKQRRHDFKSDKLASRATSHIKSAATLSMGAQIGSGTFGTVFRAKWQGFDVAVKQLNKVDGSTSAALQKEAMIMMGVSSPNIVRVFGMVDQPLGIIMVRLALYIEKTRLRQSHYKN
jgi:hypothetical protein